MKRIAPLTILILLVLFSHATAQELFIRNKPFKGLVTGYGTDLYAEAEPLAQAMGAQVSRHGSTLYLGEAPESEESFSGRVLLVEAEGQSIPFQTGPEGQILVSLEPAVKALYGRLVRNRELGTIDIYLEEKPTAVTEATEGAAATSAPAVSTTRLSQAGSRLRPSRDSETQLYGYKSGQRFVIEPQFNQARRFRGGGRRPARIRAPTVRPKPPTATSSSGGATMTCQPLRNGPTTGESGAE